MSCRPDRGARTPGLAVDRRRCRRAGAGAAVYDATGCRAATIAGNEPASGAFRGALLRSPPPSPPVLSLPIKIAASPRARPRRAERHDDNGYRTKTDFVGPWRARGRWEGESCIPPPRWIDFEGFPTISWNSRCELEREECGTRERDRTSIVLHRARSIDRTSNVSPDRRKMSR